MGFQRLAAPDGSRPTDALPAAPLPAPALPDRFALMTLLRAAAPALGLRAPVLATLDVMLSCLPPQRGHHIVFASNATLVARGNGICDRTLRRHAAVLVDAGLIARQDSANGKRFARRAGGAMAAFGFDLGPLFARLAEIAALAADARAAADRIALLRCRLRAAVQQALAADPSDAFALDLQPLLRRKLDEDALLRLCDAVALRPALAAETPVMSAADGQNVRHHQKSETEHIDKDAATVSLPDLLSACTEAAQFAAEPVRTTEQVLRHARMLAPMIGISPASYDQAEQAKGAVPVALTIWLILQMGGKVRQAGAYFRAVTTGRRSAGFDPGAVIARLAARALSADIIGRGAALP